MKTVRTSAFPTSLKLRLGVGAALTGAGTLLIALILYLGLKDVAERLDTALAAEARMARYATLSQQAASFLVVATEAVQTGLPRDSRRDRITPVADQMRRTFGFLQDDVEAAVEDVRALGIDAQSRYGTQSLGLARMEALLKNMLVGLDTDDPDQSRLRAHIDTFASGFDPLLSQAVNSELLFRNNILTGIEDLRQRLTWLAATIALASALIVGWFYFGLIRPQFLRLDQLRSAASRIGQEDFAISLPDSQRDEIGTLYAETNRMAAALAERKSAVQAEWDRLNDTIAQRTTELQDANARLEQIDANRRRFFADISHELRTPLTVILAEAEIGRQGSAAQEAFRVIENRAARLNRRIDDLLRVARSDTGQLALDLKPVDLSALIKKIVEDISPEIDNAGMQLAHRSPPNLEVTADSNWLRQVIVSLIRNAITYASEGKQITLAAETDAADVVISVIDRGPGIPETDHAAVFDRFRQGELRSTKGFGIGLALAKWVIEAQGGSIAIVTSAKTPGTKIAIRLPHVTR